MSDQDQLAWEARFGRGAAAFAFVSGFLLLAGTFLLQSMVEDRGGERIRALTEYCSRSTIAWHEGGLQVW